MKRACLFERIRNNPTDFVRLMDSIIRYFKRRARDSFLYILIRVCVCRLSYGQSYPGVEKPQAASCELLGVWCAF